MRVLTLILLSAFSIVQPVFAATMATADKTALLDNVTAVDAPGGLPGDIVVFGDKAFTVLTGKSGKADLPLFAATRYGKGRAVAGGHEGFFGPQALENHDNMAFASNIAAWVAAKPVQGLHITCVGQSEALRKSLEQAGAAVTNATPTELRNALRSSNEVWLDQASLDGSENAATVRTVRDWVKAGGGLVVTGPGWGWQSLHEGQTLADDQSANRLVIAMGLAFGGGTLDRNAKGGFSPESASLALTSAPESLVALQDQTSGKRTLTVQETDEITSVLGQAVGSLPERTPFVRKVEALCEKQGSVIPSPQTPITKAMPFARLHCVLDAQRYRNEPASQVKADPSAGTFPGAVPADAKRERVTLSVDTRIPDWHSTGRYAAPGETITVSIPANAASKGLAVRIGSQTDTLWNVDKWNRFPEISMLRPLNSAENRVASPFGGAIFLVVPNGSRLGTVDVVIDGAVASPLFVRGVTTRDEWKRSIRHAPGPWAELQGNLVTLSVPSSAVRDLDDPEALMTYWDTVMENCYAFFAAPKRSRPERYSVDRQISAGYMHSGYPIMTFEDVAKTFCTVDVLRGPDAIKCWGFYHEMGHNFQQPEWTWADFGEVTNNLFSLYGTEKMNGAMSGAHPAMTLEEMGKREKLVAAAPGKERYYAKDPWYPLTMFWLMRHEFGWAPFTQLFTEFRELPEAQKPHSEMEKHDQFLVQFSKATGHNLTQYLSAWGVETTPQAQATVADLPNWMPAELAQR